MLQDEKTERGIKKAIQRLITPEENYGIKDLDLLYHDDMIVTILDENDNINVFYKEAFKNMIAGNLKNREDHLANSWAKFQHVEVKGDKGFIIVLRKINLTGAQTKLVVSLDFVWEANRWQIVRENIYSQVIH